MPKAAGARSVNQEKRPRRTARAADRLRRLLVIVPHVVQHPGSSLGELAQLFEANENELLEDLNLLFMSGLPPYGPGDLIDVDVSEGRVWIGMADYFGRPVRLTHSEALALYLKGKALLGAGRPLYTRTERDIPVRLLLGPGARWVTEYYEAEDVRRRDDGLVEATLPAKDLPWLAKLVLRLGGEAAVLDPPELADMVRRTTQETLARYRSKG